MWYTTRIAQNQIFPDYNGAANDINNVMQPSVGPVEAAENEEQEPTKSPLELAQEQQTRIKDRLYTPLNQQLGRARSLNTPIGEPEEADNQAMTQQLNGEPPVIRSNGALGVSGTKEIQHPSLSPTINWSR